VKPAQNVTGPNQARAARRERAGSDMMS